MTTSKDNLHKLHEAEISLLMQLNKVRQLIKEHNNLNKKVDRLLEEINDNTNATNTVTSKGHRVTNDKSIIQYAVEVLSRHGIDTGLDTWQIINHMYEIGFTSHAKDVYLSVFAVLNRHSKRENSMILKIGSKWRLDPIDQK